MIDLLPQVPVNLLRAGRIFVFEPPPGMKANMLRTFSNIPVARMCKVRPHIVKNSLLFFTSFWFIMLLFFSHSLQTKELACTSSWPGSTPSSRSASVTLRSAGPRSTSSESLTCARPATPSTPGWTIRRRSERVCRGVVAVVVVERRDSERLSFSTGSAEHLSG